MNCLCSCDNYVNVAYKVFTTKYFATRNEIRLFTVNPGYTLNKIWFHKCPKEKKCCVHCTGFTRKPAATRVGNGNFSEHFEQY